MSATAAATTSRSVVSCFLSTRGIRTSAVCGFRTSAVVASSEGKMGFRKKQDGKKEVKRKPRGERGRIFAKLPDNALGHPLFEQPEGDLEELVDLPALVENNLKPCNTVTLNRNALRAFGVPRNLLVENRLLAQPVTVIREATCSLTQRLKKAAGETSESNRVVITGNQGSGKSVLLVQAAHYAHSAGWLVLYIPRAIALLKSTSPYAYDARTRLYTQPEISRQLLRRFLFLNSKPLKELRTADGSQSLIELIEQSVIEPSIASSVLERLLGEIAGQSQVPVLVAVDDFQALYRTSSYRDAHYVPIGAQHFTIPRLLLEYASGRRTLKKGAFLGAISSSDRHFSAPLELTEQLGITLDMPAHAWDQRRASKIAFAKGLEAFPLPNTFTLDEAASVFELWMKSRSLSVSDGDETKPLSDPKTNYDDLFLKLYTTSTGVPREFVWNGLLSSIATS